MEELYQVCGLFSTFSQMLAFLRIIVGFEMTMDIEALGMSMSSAIVTTVVGLQSWKDG